MRMEDKIYAHRKEGRSIGCGTSKWHSDNVSIFVTKLVGLLNISIELGCGLSSLDLLWVWDMHLLLNFVHVSLSVSLSVILVLVTMGYLWLLVRLSFIFQRAHWQMNLAWLSHFGSKCLRTSSQRCLVRGGPNLSGTWRRNWIHCSKTFSGRTGDRPFLIMLWRPFL